MLFLVQRFGSLGSNKQVIYIIYLPNRNAHVVEIDNILEWIAKILSIIVPERSKYVNKTIKLKLKILN